MSVENLDLTDSKILSELDKNARISYSELGKKIRVAKETVKYRIAQLEKSGVIKGYYTVINFSKIGYSIYRLYIRLQNIPPKTEQQMIDYLISSKKVAVFYKINGPFHLALGIWAKDQWDYEQFYSELKQKFGEYISSSHFSLFTEYLEFSHSYLLPGEEKITFTTLTKTNIEKTDELDFRLLSYLSNNSRASLVEIAKSLGTSIVTARYHLKNLINKKIIIGFRPIFDLQKFGRQYFKVDLWLISFDKKKEIRQHILSNPDVIFAERSIGGSDLEFDFEIDGFEKFIELMDGFKEKFPEEIKDYKYYSLIVNYKTSYIPSF